jgi:hypothetical protein
MEEDTTWRENDTRAYCNRCKAFMRNIEYEYWYRHEDSLMLVWITAVCDHKSAHWAYREKGFGSAADWTDDADAVSQLD